MKLTEDDREKFLNFGATNEDFDKLLENQEKAEKFDEISDKDKCGNEARANRWAIKLDAVEQENKRLIKLVEKANTNVERILVIEEKNQQKIDKTIKLCNEDQSDYATNKFAQTIIKILEMK